MWGGDIERRMNFPLAVARAVREGAGSNMIAGFRITPFESEANGYTLNDAVVLAARLSALDLDYIHISLDNFRWNAPIPESRDWSIAPAVRTDIKGNPIREMARAVGGHCAVVAAGSIKTLSDTDAALAEGADIVAIGRAVLIDPDWLKKIRAGSEAEIATHLPHEPAAIASQGTVPPRMVDYLLSRPGWIPRAEE
jgi:2,4-dienoyl-CoA reductase-like NADH-dependent reductase (Old Yellow Enzyme family)